MKADGLYFAVSVHLLFAPAIIFAWFCGLTRPPLMPIVGQSNFFTKETIKNDDNAMKSSQTTISKESIIKLLGELVQTFLTETSNITFDKYNVQHLYLMCLYGRIFELGVSALNLMKANDHAGVPVILRSQLEAFVDFANLIEDKDFIKTIAATFVDQKKRLYDNLKKHLDPSEVPSVTNDYTEKAAIGFKPQTIWQRFKNIKLQKTYITAYFILCSYGHNNLAM